MPFLAFIMDRVNSILRESVENKEVTSISEPNSSAKHVRFKSPVQNAKEGIVPSENEQVVKLESDKIEKPELDSSQTETKTLNSILTQRSKLGFSIFSIFLFKWASMIAKWKSCPRPSPR